MNSSHFHTTHWSVVLAAKGDDTNARSALKMLCETYYMPLRRFIERETATDSLRCYGGCDADDLTQDFITQLLVGKMFGNLKRNGDTFRSYLLGAVKHFLAKIRRRESAAKRGGTFSQTPLSDDTADPSSANDAIFDADWARTMIAQALNSLDKTPEIHSPILLPWLMQEMDASARSRIAAELSMSEGAVKVALSRLRKRFREIIRSLIAETVGHPSEINGELDHLIRALRGTS